MALQVWLPLDGNLTNNGLTNASVTTNGTVTFTDAGKIGKCATFAGAGNLNLPASTMTSFTECSVAFWLKINNWHTKYSTFFQAGGYGPGWTMYKFGILRNGSGNTLTFVFTNNSGTCTQGSYNSSTLSTDIWYHLAFTYKSDGSVKIYINGQVDKSYTTTTIPYFAGITNITIGRCTNPSYCATYCNMNDFRIYDHCLSAEEVKKISQGLILHLPLNRNGFGVGNLLTNSNVIVNSSSYNLHDYYFVSGKAPADGETVTIQMKATLASGKTYFGIYNSGGNLSPTQLNSTHLKNGIYTRTFTWKVTNGSYTASNTYLRVYHMPNSVTATSTIDWIKLESGSEATTWSPNTSDTTYFYDWTTEKDVSGLSHNGTKIGNFSYSRNTPTYGMSTVFNGTNSTIALGTSSLVKDAITFSCWAYKTSWAQCDQRLLSCTQSGGWCFYLNNTSMQVYVGTGTSSNTYIVVAANTPFTSLSAGWHLFTATYDGHKVCLYIDGILDASVTRYTSKTPVYYYSPTGLFVGAEAGTDTTTPAGSYYSGNLSDVRIYATALSADDVKALYENRL